MSTHATFGMLISSLFELQTVGRVTLGNLAVSVRVPDYRVVRAAPALVRNSVAVVDGEGPAATIRFRFAHQDLNQALQAATNAGIEVDEQLPL